MRVLVTGAFGFIGSAVGRLLAADGHLVTAMTSRPLDTIEQPSFAISVRRADVRDADQVAAAVQGADAICHLAGIGRVRESFQRPARYHAVNADGTAAVIAAARTAGLGKLVFASSVTVYGVPARQPIAEDAPLKPANPYGESKAAAEASLTAAARDGWLGAVALRIFNAAGADGGRPDPGSERIIPRVLAVAKGQSPFFEVNGDGSAVRDYVHVTDVARAFVLALAATRPGTFAAYNVGATGASVAEVVSVAREVTGRPIRVQHKQAADEPPRLIADCQRIRAELGWIPKRSAMRQIMTDAWQAAR